MSDKITKGMLSEWLRHPVTKGHLKLVEDLLDSNKEDLIARVMNGQLKDQEEIISQLKGQILAMEAVLRTKEFLEELTEDEVKSK